MHAPREGLEWTRGMKAGSEEVRECRQSLGTKINGCNIASITGGRAFFSGLVES